MSDEPILGLKVRISGDSSELKESLEAGDEALKEFGVNIGKIKEFLTGGAGLAIAFAVAAKEGIEAALQFEEAGQVLGRTSGQLGDNLTQMKSGLAEVMQSGVEASVGELAQAMGQLNVRFGATGPELTAMTKQFAEFADVTGQNTASAVIDMSKVLARFNIDGSQTEEVMDKLTFAAQKSGVSAQSLAQSLIGAGAIFKSANMDINDSISLLVGFEKGGVDSSKALFGLRQAITGFQKDGQDAGVELRKLIEDIKNTKDPAEAAALAAEKFGRGSQEMLQAIKGGFVDIDGFNKQLENSAGTLKRTADGTKTTEEMMKQLSNQVQSLAAESFGALLEIGKPIIELIQGMLKIFEALPGPIKQTIEVTAILVGSLKILQVTAALVGRELTVAFGPVGLIIAGVVGLAEAISYLSTAEERENVERQRQIDNAKKQKELVDQAIGPVNDLTKNNKLSAEAIDKLIAIYPELTGKMEANNTTVERANQLAKEAGINNQSKLLDEANKKLDEENKNYQELINRQNELKKEIAETNVEARKSMLAEYLQEATVASKESSSKLADYNKQIRDIKANINDLNGIKTPEMLDAERIAAAAEAMRRYTESWQDAAKAIENVNTLLRRGDIDQEEALKRKIAIRNSEIDNITKAADKAGKYTTQQLADLESLMALNKENQALLDAIEQKKTNDAQADKVIVQAQIDDENLRHEAIVRGWAEQKKVAEETAKTTADAWKTSGEIMSANFQQLGGVAASITSAISDDFKNTFKDIGAITSSVFNFINAQMTASAQKQIALLNSQMVAEEKAAGVAEKTALEKAKISLTAAQNQLAGETDATKIAADQQAVIDTQSAVTKAQIEENYQKKIADLQYQTAHNQWELQILQIAAAGALAVMQGYAQLGPIGGTIAGVIVTGVTIAEEAILLGNEPQPPAFASGTDFAPGGSALVGEHGREIVNLPRGSQVFPNGTTEQMLAGSKGHTFNFNNPQQMSPVEQARAFESTMRRMSFQGAGSL